MAKRMRLPNGFGQISKINKRLRNPWRAMITVGWSDEGKPKRKTLGYYHTYNEAYSALMKYHDDPTILDTTTMLELYEMWSPEHYKTIGVTSHYEKAWERCGMIYHMRVRDVRAINIKQVVEGDMPPTQHRLVKQLLSMMFDYAIEHDMAVKNYARLATVNINEKDKKSHIPYTEEELDTLWKNRDHECVDMILVLCYTGLRPNEFLKIKRDDVNISEWYLVGGSKTDAGKNRIVPIHTRIRPIILKWYEEKREFIAPEITYQALRNHFVEISMELSLNEAHLPHDGRVTFVTRMKNANANEYAIKRIIGHVIKDLTENTYTKRPISWLHEEVAKIS